MTAGLYIHIPFCDIRCGYCDFYTVTKKNQQIPAYLAALKQELDIYSEQQAWQHLQFSTLFLGGGTPSILTPDQIASLIHHVRSRFDFAADCEITLETNPNTVAFEKLRALLDAGINRLSLGVQSFHADELEFLDRDHSAQQSVNAFEAARKAGFDNISVDLIYALPNQSLKQWQDTLSRARSLQPEHISAYCLTYEDGTPLAVQLRKGRFTPSLEENQRAIQLATIEMLQAAGYLQYEISNFARPGFHSRHNQKYWDRSPYLGIGASAHSFIEETRFWNPRSMHGYMNALQEGVLPTDGSEELGEAEISFECLYLGLRQNSGVNLKFFTEKTGLSIFKRYGPVLNKFFSEDFVSKALQIDFTNGTRHLESKLLQITDGHLRLTPEGIPLCDAICTEFV